MRSDITPATAIMAHTGYRGPAASCGYWLLTPPKLEVIIGNRFGSSIASQPRRHSSPKTRIFTPPDLSFIAWGASEPPFARFAPSDTPPVALPYPSVAAGLDQGQNPSHPRQLEIVSPRIIGYKGNPKGGVTFCHFGLHITSAIALHRNSEPDKVLTPDHSGLLRSYGRRRLIALTFADPRHFSLSTNIVQHWQDDDLPPDTADASTRDLSLEGYYGDKKPPPPSPGVSRVETCLDGPYHLSFQSPRLSPHSTRVCLNTHYKSHAIPSLGGRATLSRHFPTHDSPNLKLFEYRSAHRHRLESTSLPLLPWRR
ncbi:hypothetical protein CIB48_g6711 [Xylaria polymorpha]|nr:hypothetical protein CIB48_g6711 [Xylaria polymorpha]